MSEGGLSRRRESPRSSPSAWLVSPRTRGWSVAAWVLATALFVSLTLVLGGPSQADSSQSVYSALLIAHGDWSCAYPPPAFSHLTGGSSLVYTSPLYTLVSAGVARLLGIAGAAPFPSPAQLGSQCAHAMARVAGWAQSVGVLTSMLRVGFVSWIVLAGGLVTTLRACQRGRNGREAVTLLAVACSAPVFSCLEAFFHPEDVMAMGIIMLVVAGVVRERWVMVGVLLALGVLTQLFVVVALIPVALIVPRERRRVFAAGVVGTFLVVVTPLAMVTSGRIVRVVFFATSRAGDARVVGAGGTVVFAAGLHGTMLFLVSRVAPLVAAALVGCYVVRTRRGALRDPVVVTSLVGTCLVMRLVFEVNAFGYYYMAAIVALLVLDALRGRFRGETFALVALVTLAYSPVAWGFVWRGALEGPTLRAIAPFVATVPVLALVVVDLLHRRVRWYLVGWLVLVAVAFLRLPLPVHEYRAVVASWAWQLVLVPSLLYLLSAPLRDASPRRVATRPLAPFGAKTRAR